VGLRRAAGDRHSGFALAQVWAEYRAVERRDRLEAFASLGLGAAAFVGFVAHHDPRYTATQYALFSSLSAVPRTLINASVGFLVAELGWFFIVCFFLAFPAMMMLPNRSMEVCQWHQYPLNITPSGQPVRGHGAGAARLRAAGDGTGWHQGASAVDLAHLCRRRRFQ
jgi:hypothetical protein